jgi:glycosyltransferase involved in cell wall biosynthesis
MRIVLLSEPQLTNSNYRAYQPLGVLEQQGHEVLQNRMERPLRPDEVLGADVVHIHRIATPELQELVGAARQQGVGVVWDNDDDVTAVPRSNPLYAKHGGFKSRDMRAGVLKMVRLADVVTTPSAVLAEQYRELGAADARVLENFVPREFDKIRPTKHAGVVIACLAALEHQVDYQQLGLRETLQRLLDEHPDLRVMSIGLGLGLPPERYEHTPHVPFLELARALASADIGIAPLVDIPWNRARSNVKLKEYASAGLPWLASPVGPYLSMGEEHGGRLVPDDGWHAALERLIVDARARRKLAKRAAKWVKGQGIERHAHLWETALRDALERGRERARAPRAAAVR